MAGKLGTFVARGLLGLLVLVLIGIAISFVLGIIKTAISLAILLGVGYLVWRAINAVVR